MEDALSKTRVSGTDITCVQNCLCIAKSKTVFFTQRKTELKMWTNPNNSCISNTVSLTKLVELLEVDDLLKELFEENEALPVAAVTLLNRFVLLPVADTKSKKNNSLCI